ncbi:MAG: ADP-ribosylglycohydrolase family protein [Verrucomicrobiota bacterium]
MMIACGHALTGCLLGTAMGDAMGLACEGLSRDRQLKFYPRLDTPRFFLWRGMTSDDTEHTCMVAQSLIVCAGDEAAFRCDFARRLRFWLLGLPAGIGLATLRSILKLWFGFPPERSGVFSAGNGPAMRSAIIGVAYADHPERLRALVRASTRITHTDPKAEHGAFVVALAARFASRRAFETCWQTRFCESLRQEPGAGAQELIELVDRARESAHRGETTGAFAESLGLGRGVSGYVYHTVPVVMHAWFSHPLDFRKAIEPVIRCGGDTDTTAAILGGILGAAVGREGIPTEWLNRLMEWPRTVSWLEQLGGRLGEVSVSGRAQPALPLSVTGLFLRNMFFAIVVLAHGFRRLLPPY